MSVRLTLAASIVCGTLFLTACVGNNDSSTWSTPVLPEDLPRITAATSLPFDAYQLSDVELSAIQRGQIEKLVACAREYGAELSFSGDFVRPKVDSRTQWGGRFGTMDVEHASQYGYHPSPNGAWSFVGGHYIRDPGNVQLVPFASTSEDASADQQIIVYGPATAGSEERQLPVNGDGNAVPDGGCWKRVETEIDAPLLSFTDVAVDVYNLAIVDERVAKAAKSWSSCMISAGYDFTEVDGAVNSFALAELSPKEVETAVADADCTDHSRWADVFYAVLGDYQRQAIKKDPSQFEAALASQRARLAALSSNSN